MNDNNTIRQLKKAILNRISSNQKNERITHYFEIESFVSGEAGHKSLKSALEQLKQEHLVIISRIDDRLILRPGDNYDNSNTSGGKEYYSFTNFMFYNWEKIVGFVFGVTFIFLLLYVNINIPKPTPTQYQTFKIILSLAAAGVGGVLAGFIQVEGNFQKVLIRAGGALALFIIVFFFEPAIPKPFM